MDAGTRAEFEQLFGAKPSIVVDPSALERRFTIPERNRAMVREFRQGKRSPPSHKGRGNTLSSCFAITPSPLVGEGRGEGSERLPARCSTMAIKTGRAC